MKYCIIILSLILFNLSCAKYEVKSDLLAQSISKKEIIRSDNTHPQRVSAEPKFLIKNATINIEVNQMDSSINKLYTIIDDNDGYIGNLNMTKGHYEVTNQIEIRVPSKNLTSCLLAIERLSTKVTDKKINTIDVGEEYVDAESRLKTQEEVYNRYMAVLRNKTKTIDDILTTEYKIGQIQEDIEATKGKLNYLNNRIKMSTIQLVITQEIIAHKDPTVASLFFQKAGKNLGNGWASILRVILVILNFWPVVLFASIFFIYKKRWLSYFNWFRAKKIKA